MGIISENFFTKETKPSSKERLWLNSWCTIVRSAQWAHIGEVRKHYPSADAAEVASGKIVTIFNVCGNDFRLITAIHYDRQRIFVLKLMTHSDYSKNRGKNDL